MDPLPQSNLKMIATGMLGEFRDGDLGCECVHLYTYGLGGLSKVSFNFICNVLSFYKENIFYVAYIFKNQKQNNERQLTVEEQVK